MNGLVKRDDYCQFLMVSQVNYTGMYFAAHGKGFSHDAATRYLARDYVRPSSVWEKAKADMVVSPQGQLVFDDSVIDKNHSREIAMVQRQYSGNEKRVIRGIGLISCVYVNPELNEFWVIDYRIYDPDTDAKDKHQHVSEMYDACCERQLQEELEFRAVLMDICYAKTKLMVKIHRSKRLFYCPIKGNRSVSEVKPEQKYSYQAAETLAWSLDELDLGKVLHLREFPQGLDVKLFRIADSSDGTELIVSNDDSPSLDAEAVRQAQGFRWKLEQFHRELKAITGVDACQCRKARSQRNHIGCALLVWLSFKRHASRLFSTVYALKQGLLDHYIKQQLRAPALVFS